MLSIVICFITYETLNLNVQKPYTLMQPLKAQGGHLPVQISSIHPWEGHNGRNWL